MDAAEKLNLLVDKERFVKGEVKKAYISLMDRYSGKRAGGGFGIAGRGAGLSFRDASHHDGRSVHCNRMVCSNRHNFTKNPQVGNSDKDKTSSSFRTTGKTIVGSSSNESAVTNYRKASLESQDPSSHKEILPAETNTIRLEKVNRDPSCSSARVRIKLPTAKDVKSGVLESHTNTFEKLDTYSVTSNSRTQKQIHNQSGQRIQETTMSSSTRHYFGPRNTKQTAKIGSHGQGFTTSRSSSSMPQTNRYGLKNLGCASISDVLPPARSSPDSSHSGRAEIAKRSPDGEYTSSKGKIIAASSSAGNSVSRKNYISRRSLSLPERSSQPTSRRTRYWLPSRNGVTSVRTRRTTSEDIRTRLSEHENDISQFEPPVMIPQLLQGDGSVTGSSSSLAQRSVQEMPATGQNSLLKFGRNENAHTSPIAHSQDGSDRQFNGISIDRDGYRRYNRDGIAEVLLALERIEQDEELSYEHLLILETNLFLSGLGFSDQHRDMRLDIDNMSYEELLALGEKMGAVSTGLTEEQLSNSLKRSYYRPAPPHLKLSCGDDNIKCSICQEEYVETDEVGTLRCDHRYHLACINQWLRLKNWCPICKSQAADS